MLCDEWSSGCRYKFVMIVPSVKLDTLLVPLSANYDYSGGCFS